MHRGWQGNTGDDRETQGIFKRTEVFRANCVISRMWDDLLLITVSRVSSLKRWSSIMNCTSSFLIFSKFLKLYLWQTYCFFTYPIVFFIKLKYAISTNREFLNFQKPFPFINLFTLNIILQENDLKDNFFQI